MPFKNFHSLSALFYPFGSIFKILFFGGIAFHIAYTIYIYASERKIIKIRSPILTEMAHCTVMYSWESHSENSNFVQWKNNFMNFAIILPKNHALISSPRINILTTMIAIYLPHVIRLRFQVHYYIKLWQNFYCN